MSPRVRTSSFCSSSTCVGVRISDDGVDVIDTKGEAQPLHFDHAEWAAFVAGVKAGEFDPGP